MMLKRQIMVVMGALMVLLIVCMFVIVIAAGVALWSLFST